MDSCGHTAPLEQELIDCVSRAFGKTLKKVDRLGGAWTEATVRTLTATAPAVYVAWIGGRRDVKRRVIIGTWALFSAASALSGQRNDAAGAHQINDHLISLIEGRQFIDACGAAVFTQIANLYSDTSARTGTVVCGLYFEIPQYMPDCLKDGDIGIFETYHHQWPVEDGAPVQESHNTSLYSGAEHE